MTRTAESYRTLYSKLAALVEGEHDITAVLANISALLKEELDYFWTGFYLVRERQGKDALVLGPFQGEVACYQIEYGKGVCGTAWKEKRTLIVPDVHQFPGHIACSSRSASEIVVPLFDTQEEVKGVLDIDSLRPDDFTSTDRDGLEAAARLISQHLWI